MFSNKVQIETPLSKFIERSPHSPKYLNEREIFRGRQTSPFVFATEVDCYAPQLKMILGPFRWPHRKRCAWFYMKARIRSAAASAMLKMPHSQRMYLNGGGMVGRVWAYKEPIQSYKSLKSLRESEWWCDQSIWNLLFVWSVTQSRNVERKLIMRRSLVSLDFNTEFFYYCYDKLDVMDPILHFAWKR